MFHGSCLEFCYCKNALYGFGAAPVAGGRVGGSRVSTPAQDYFDGRINLNEHLIKDVTSTFVVRVSGDSMEGAGISDGDELIVNRALTPRDGSIVVPSWTGS